MGAFFRSGYDLMVEVNKDTESFLGNLDLSLKIVDRVDLEDDVKDAVVGIISASDDGEAEEIATSLLVMLEDAIGTSKKVEKRN
jgi:hypothetical protein